MNFSENGKNQIQGYTWEETLGKVFAEIESCCSVSQLKVSRFIYTSLIEHIKDLRLFFRCEYSNNITKIIVSMNDEEFMCITVNGSFSTVPDYMQAEITELLQELSETAMERIDERISAVNEKRIFDEKEISYISANETEISANPDDSFEQANSENDKDKGKTAFIDILVTILIIGLIVLLFLVLKQLIGDNDVIENTVQELAAVTSTVTSDETSATELITLTLTTLKRLIILWLPVCILLITCLCIAKKLCKRLFRK